MNDYIEKLFSLKGKVAVVTGASRGIGAKIAFGLSNAGASVVGIARSSKPQRKLEKGDYRQCDILNISAYEKICQEVHHKFGRIDILVNSAGISLPVTERDSRALFSQILNTNLVSTYNCCDIVVKFMQASGGSIINISSIGSYLGFPGNPGYVASKGGVSSLAKALALDYSSKNIRVNNIAPGYIRTNMTKKSYLDETLNRERVNRMMIKRWGETEDLAGAAIYLASDASSYVTGVDLIVDGGWTAKGL
jgi:NAD(P)-dependent dehydrogenase (short-subunit alcohol dehydrogenase family)